MEAECVRLYIVLACVVLLVGACNGSNQGLRTSHDNFTNDIANGYNLSELESRSRGEINNEERSGIYSYGNNTGHGVRSVSNFSDEETSDVSEFKTVSIANINDISKQTLSKTDIIETNSTFSKISGEMKVNVMSDRPELNTVSELHTRNKNSMHRNAQISQIDIENYILSEGTSIVTEVNSVELAVSNVSEPCSLFDSVEIRDYVEFENGSILSSDEHPILYPLGMYWESTEDNLTTTRGCVCLLMSCIRKCCPQNMSLTEEGECIESDNTLLYPFQPQFIEGDPPVLINYNNSEDINISFVYGNPCLYGSYRIDPLDKYEPEHFYLRPNGMLETSDGYYKFSEFCVELFNDVERILPLVCFPPEEDALPMEEDSNVYVLYPIGMIISLPFLFTTFIVYAVIPELRNLHGKCLMCHVFTLFIAYIFLAIVQLGGDELVVIFCVTCAFVIFFSFHASFFWLNVMCFDIWWTFSGLRPLRGSAKEREYKKFVMYSCYAWGAPLIMLIVCLLMDLLPEIPSTYIKPEFGVNKCWFSAKTAALAYFFGPIGVIVFCNIILFITTAIRIVHLKRETKMLKGGESKRHDDEANRQRFNLYLKLFIVMGVNWMMEVISWAVEGPTYLWYITDIGNTLQGVLIFIIFVWKDKIRRLLKRKFFPTLATRSEFEGSTRSQCNPTPSRASSLTYTTRASVSLSDQFALKPMPNGSYRSSNIYSSDN